MIPQRPCDRNGRAVRPAHDPVRTRGPAHASLLLRALPLCLFLLWSCRDSSSTQETPSDGSTVALGGSGDHVASLVAHAPSIDAFVLRGTVPLPPGRFPRADGTLPYSVVDEQGSPFPTQVEIVSRYADGDGDGADVVEILARVRLPHGVGPGQRLHYEVVRHDHAPQPIVVPNLVRDLLSNPRPIVLRARDVFGNVYVADLSRGDGPPVMLRDGVAVREWRTHATLLPLVPNGTTLPHLMGVHAYFRVFNGEPVAQLDLRVHNGHSGLDPADPTDDPLDTVYFESLELVLPGGWEVTPSFESPLAGPTQQLAATALYPVVRADPGGKMHVMPRHGQFIRRLTIGRAEHAQIARSYAAEEGLAFCRSGKAEGGELYSWWNPQTARYFPQCHRLPDLTHVDLAGLASDLADDFSYLAQVVETGSTGVYPILTGNLGWAHPWGIDYGGQAGGTEILLYDGVRVAAAASVPGYRKLELKHRMYTSRHPMALFDRGGDPASYMDWVLPDGMNGPWLPVWCFLVPLTWAADPFGFEDAPTFQVEAVQALGLEPDYQRALFIYEPIDIEHLVRYTNPAKALAWLGNDSLAKDSLMMQAEAYRMGYNDLPNSEYDHLISTGLARDIRFVGENPGIGFSFGRLEGWGIEAVTAAYRLAPPSWRAAVLPWFGEVVDVVRDGQSDCTGIIQAAVYGTFFEGHYRARQSIEQAIVENMLWGLGSSVYDGLDAARTQEVADILIQSTYSMVGAPAWSPELAGPVARLAVGELDVEIPPFCANVPPDGTTDWADTYQTWCSLAYGFELTGDPLFLQRANEMAQGSALDVIESQGLSNIENKIALLALLQEMP